jgi:hypothetical protein
MNLYLTSKIRVDDFNRALVDLPQAMKPESNPSTTVIGVAESSPLKR